MKNNINRKSHHKDMFPPATLERLFGPTATVKVVDFLIDNKELDYSLSDIARGAGVAWSTMNLIWPRLEKNGMVIKTREVGRATLYKLNENEPFVKHLVKADWELSKREVKTIAQTVKVQT